MRIREARIEDIKQIQEIEKDYYEGFNCDNKILKSWINSENFLVAEINNKIQGFIFFEYLDKIKAIPFIHKPITGKGQYAYISEIGVINSNIKILQQLVDKLIERSKKDGCKMIVWLTGDKMKHDKIELKLLLNNGFEKKENVKHWEAFPNHFVDTHNLWVKKLI